ncbi:MAG TPA: mycothiol system anti-sigma-R factor [Acidimicrobiales bacterium]|jgi:mycothiol system anti-sigma-R factor|nr:mycothiol system anti-sigma-R factor [Acidimicrobiales bacterium]
MSDCQDALHELYGFLDGELTEERKAAIRQHLDECQPCAEPYDFEAELREVVRRKCQEQVPEALMTKVRAALASEAARLRD